MQTSSPKSLPPTAAARPTPVEARVRLRSVLVAWLGWFSVVGGVAFAGLAAPALALASPASD
ncbi:MAG: hypothetical protein ABW321_14705, partial [Polyangiales bacterium]